MAEAALGPDGPSYRPTQRGLLLALRFGLVGLLNTAFGYAVYAVLILINQSSWIALVLATGVGMLFNFYTARHLVFGQGGRLIRFITVYCVVLVANLVALRLLREAGVAPLPAQAILALPVAALSFAGQRFWVFSGPAPA